MLAQMTAASLDFDTGPTGTQIAGALVVENVAAQNWDDSCDILVIGCGLAGASAALKAAEAKDVSITVVDRFDGGGASQASGGVLYLGGGTRVQAEVGATDTVEAMTNYLARETGNAVSRDTLEKFCRESASFIPWLESHGAHFGGPLTEDKTSYPFEEFIYYSGNERLGEFAAVATPAPRGHRTKPMDGTTRNTGYGGVDLMVPLKAAIDRTRNISFRRQAAARRLIVDRQGNVVGAEIWQVPPGSVAAKVLAKLVTISSNNILGLLGITRPLLAAITRIEKSAPRPKKIRARKGVILASGGFIFNRGMLAKVAPVFKNVAPLGTIGDDGSGIMMGQSVGAAADKLDTVSPWRFLYPPASWTKGVLVSLQGTRMVNEESYGARIGTALFEQSEGIGWLIVDQPLFDMARTEAANPRLQDYQKYIVKAAMTRYTKSAPTIEELAAKIGIPVAGLAETIRQYNDDIATGRPDAWGKAEKLRKPIAVAPFFAIDLSYRPKLNPIIGITVGGLKVDEATGGVLGNAGTPIPGLYAVGRTAVGIPSNVYVSGLSLADCVFSGWRAARSITGQP
jgi:3-oxo-5alpha-steroid 4-dehydrogenase